MKPGDHPEFFLRAAPGGASRESQIRLARDGRFFHDGELVERPSLTRALHSWVDMHPGDGRPILQNGYDWVYLEVEDTPHFVEAVSERDGGLWLRLAGGSVEELETNALSVDEAGACFANVKGGTRRARFLRSAQLSLEPWLSRDEDGKYRLELSGRSYAIAMASAQ